MGDFEASFSEDVESKYEIPLFTLVVSNLVEKIYQRQCVAGSFSGALPSQIVTEGSQGWLGANGNRADSVMAQASLTVTGKTETDTKVEHSEPTVRVRCGRRLSDKSYLGDNRLVAPKRP